MGDAVREYIDRVLRMQDERRDVGLNQQDLEDIARELGLSDDDLAAVRAEAAEHRTRAAGFARHHLYDEAIAELREAVALAPAALDVALDLAKALLAAYEAGRVEHREEAHRLALRVLDRDPGCEPAFEIVARLRKSFTTTFSPKPQRGALPTTTAGNEVTVLPWSCTHTVYDEASYFGFEGWIRNDLEDEELVEMSATIALTTPNGLVEIEARYVLTSATPPLRPGETATYTLTTKAPRDPVSHVEFQVTNIQTRPAATTYAKSETIELSWDVARPDGVEFVVAERTRSHSHGRFRIALEVTNRSNSVVEDLALSVQAFDAKGRSASGQAYLSGASTPPFLVGELRVAEAWVELDESVAELRIAVSELA